MTSKMRITLCLFIFAAVIPIPEVNTSLGFQNIYGGSILTGSISTTILGLELAAATACLAVIMAIGAALLEARSKG